MFFVHYWYGPNDDDIRLVDVVETIDAARAVAAQWPWDESARICDQFGGECAVSEAA